MCCICNWFDICIVQVFEEFMGHEALLVISKITGLFLAALSAQIVFLQV